MPEPQAATTANGAPLRDIHPGVAVVFQSFALYPWLTVEVNVRVGAHGKGFPLDAKAERVRRVIDLVGLEGFEEAYPKELSGGMADHGARLGGAESVALEAALSPGGCALQYELGEKSEAGDWRLEASRESGSASLQPLASSL